MSLPEFAVSCSWKGLLQIDSQDGLSVMVIRVRDGWQQDVTI